MSCDLNAMQDKKKIKKKTEEPDEENSYPEVRRDPKRWKPFTSQSVSTIGFPRRSWRATNRTEYSIEAPLNRVVWLFWMPGAGEWCHRYLLNQPWYLANLSSGELPAEGREFGEIFNLNVERVWGKIHLGFRANEFWFLCMLWSWCLALVSSNKILV